MLVIADPADLDQGPRSAKPGTERMCVVTRQVRPIDELIRFVAAPTGEAIPDLKRKLPGRGLWVSASHKAVAEAARRNLFAKGFKKAIKASPTLADDTDKMMLRGLIEALAMTAKAGHVVSGFTKVEDALRRGNVAILLHATNGAADGIRKLDGIARQEAFARQEALAEEEDFDEQDALPEDDEFPDQETLADQAESDDVEGAAEKSDAPELQADADGHSAPKPPRMLPIFTLLSSDELDLALGRSNVIHAAVLTGPAGKTFLSRSQTLVQYRMADDDGNARAKPSLILAAPDPAPPDNDLAD